MKHTTIIALAFGLTLPTALSGCGDSETCTKFAEHLADVIAKEKNQTLSAENRAKMVKETVQTCLDEKPEPAALQCALKAESTEAMKACEKKDEGEIE